VLILISGLVSIIHSDRPLGEVLSGIDEQTRVKTVMPRWDYLMTEMRVVITYIRLIFLPVNQNLDYDYPTYHSLFALPVFLSFLGLSALLVTSIYLLHKSQRAKRRELSSVDNQPSEVNGNKLEASSELPVDESRQSENYSLFSIYV